jgi:hypothetical protein
LMILNPRAMKSTARMATSKRRNRTASIVYSF